MKKPVCLVDMDGVLVNLLPEWLRQYRQVGGEYHTVKDFNAYNWENQVDNKELFEQVLSSGGLFSSAEPMWGGPHGLQLLNQFCDTYIVTKVGPGNARAYDAKLGWLWRHCNNFPRDRVIFTGAKHLIRGDYLVEDAPQNIDAWLNAWPEGHAFIVNQPYNKDYKHSRCTRIASLLHVEFILKGI